MRWTSLGDRMHFACWKHRTWRSALQDDVSSSRVGLSRAIRRAEVTKECIGACTACTRARGVPDNPIDQADPATESPDPLQKASGGTDFNPIGSAQAQTPQAQKQGTSLKMDPSPGEVVVLPDGSTVADPYSATGKRTWLRWQLRGAPPE